MIRTRVEPATELTSFGWAVALKIASSLPRSLPSFANTLPLTGGSEQASQALPGCSTINVAALRYRSATGSLWRRRTGLVALAAHDAGGVMTCQVPGRLSGDELAVRKIAQDSALLSFSAEFPPVVGRVGTTQARQSKGIPE